MAHMRSIISAGDYRGFHDYVRASATTYFDYSIPAWFGAMLLWVCKQSYVRASGGAAAQTLHGIVITQAKTQMYEILDDDEDVNFANAWALTPSGEVIHVPASEASSVDVAPPPAAAVGAAEAPHARARAMPPPAAAAASAAVPIAGVSFADHAAARDGVDADAVVVRAAVALAATPAVRRARAMSPGLPATSSSKRARRGGGGGGGGGRGGGASGGGGE